MTATLGAPTATGAGSARHPATRPSLGRRLRGPQDRNLWFWVFVGPFIVGLVVFVYIPILWSLWLSFYDARNTVTPTKFVGVGNYADMLSDPSFRSSLVTFIVFAAFIVPTTFVIAFGLALLVHRARIARAFFRSVFFLPTACSYVVASLVWKMSLFSGVRFGLVNTVLDMFGIGPIAWLSVTQPPWYWLVIVTARLWLQAGFYMILFLAGLQRISPTLYEAAAIDGANWWQRIWYVTLPMMRNIIAITTLFSLIVTFANFDIVRILTAGGPLDHTHIRSVPALRPATPGLPLLHGARAGPGLRARQCRGRDPHRADRARRAGPGPVAAARAAGGLTWP